MRLVDTNDVHVTVKTAVEGEVRHLRIYAIRRRVVNHDCDLGLVRELLGKVYAPGRITAVMVRQLLAANVYVGRGIRTADLKVIEVSLGEVGLLEAL